MSEEAKMKREYQIMEEMGRGKFGTVFRCYDRTTDQNHAVKVINKHLLTDRKCLEVEAKFMKFLSPHPNILRLVDAFEDSDSFSLVLELCQPLILYDHVARGPLHESHALSIMKQLLEAVTHCHRLGIAHRDVKPENILFDFENNVKLADFGSAERFRAGRKMSGVVGTPYYVAPEVVLGREYDEKVDVWSCGVVLYVMLAGIAPFDGDSQSEILKAVVRCNLRFPTTVFKSVSPSAKDLLRKMICRDPSSRISAQQALRHPWILNGGVTNNTNLS